jgi:peptidoglycan/LPS O-acetylase OafA/YrhL
MGAIRLFLALVVAFGHFRTIILIPANHDVWEGYTLGMNAGYAVMFFYMISGYLMSMVLSEKYAPNVAGTKRFYWARFTRIFSLYWPVLLVAVAIDRSYLTAFLQRSYLEKLTNIFLFGSTWVLGFSEYPGFDWNALVDSFHQTWTLDSELTFYILAPLLLRSRLISGVALIASLVVRGYFVHRYGFSDRWTYYFIPTTLCFFLFGDTAYRLSRDTIMKSGWSGMFFLSACLISLNIPTNAFWDTPRFWIAALSFAASLPGIFESTRNFAMSNWLGNLSFPVYLIHLLVLVTLAGRGFYNGPFETNPNLMMAAFIGTTLLASVGCYYLLEMPTSAIMRRLPGTRRLLPRRSSTSIVEIFLLGDVESRRPSRRSSLRAPARQMNSSGEDGGGGVGDLKARRVRRTSC